MPADLILLRLHPFLRIILDSTPKGHNGAESTRSMARIILLTRLRPPHRSGATGRPRACVVPCAARVFLSLFYFVLFYYPSIW